MWAVWWYAQPYNDLFDPITAQESFSKAIEEFSSEQMKHYLSLVEVEWGGKRMYWTMQVCFSPSKSADGLCIKSCGRTLEMHGYQNANTGIY